MEFESWRKPNESEREWKLRHALISTYYGQFSNNRLKCLSSCFVNVECYGCRYPEPVMKLLAELTLKLKNVVQQSKRELQTVPFKRMKFVPASSETDKWGNFTTSGNDVVGLQNNLLQDNSEACSHDISSKAVLSFAEIPDDRICPKRSQVGLTCSSLPNMSKSKQKIMKEETCAVNVSHQGSLELLNVESNPRDVSGTSEASELSSQFYALGRAVKEVVQKVPPGKNDTEVLQMAMDKCKASVCARFSQSGVANVVFTCTLYINNVLVAVAEASTKKASKRVASAKAVELLQRPYLLVNDDSQLIGSCQPFDSNNLRSAQSYATTQQTIPAKEVQEDLVLNKVACQLPKNINESRNILSRQQWRQCLGGMSEFVILRQMAASVSDEVAAVSILQQSASFNKLELIYNYEEGDAGYCCDVFLNGHGIANAVGETRPSAQLAAAQEALNQLGRVFCTVIVKSSQDVMLTDSVQRAEVMDGNISTDKIPDSNMGSMLLKKMGWTGGGIGKDGSQGIEEPVSVSAVVNRAGLGSGVLGSFSKAVNRIVTDYLRSDREDDLVFSPDFNNQERAVIHSEARKYAQQLRTRSYGSKDTRYLVLSRRRTPMQLVDHLRKNGGETLKYKLLEPSE